MQRFTVTVVMITLLSATAFLASNGQTERMRGGPASSGAQAIRETRLYYESPRRGDARHAIFADTRLLGQIDSVSAIEV